MESYSQTFRNSQGKFTFDNRILGGIAANKCLLFFAEHIVCLITLLVLPQYSGGERQINCSFRFTNVYIERTKFKELSLMNFEANVPIDETFILRDLEDEYILNEGSTDNFCQRL